MAIQTDGIVLKNRKVKSVYFLLEIDCPTIAREAKPGQFVMVLTSDAPYPLLRRPFSIYKIYSEKYSARMTKRRFSILYKRVGKGTQLMSAFRKGQTVNLIGPLGNGFTLSGLPDPSPVILIGGGVGIATLASLAGKLGSGPLYVFIGGKSKYDILCEKDFPGGKIFIATEDGSLGKRGTVVDLFESEMERFDRKVSHHLFCCGPEGMLRSLARLIPSEKWVVQASLESRMGCGFGACWGCVVKTTDVESPFRRVCKDGPVFPLSEILWDER